VKFLPITPLHYPIAYLIHKVDERLSLPGLIVGSMQPDIEIPLLYLITGDRLHSRLVLHSLFGAVVFGTLLSTMLIVFLYPWVVSFFFGYDKNEINRKCRFSPILVISCLIGNISHVLLDLSNHEYNPLLWPFLPAESCCNPICPLLGGYTNASLIIHVIMLMLLLLIIMYEWKHTGDDVADLSMRLLIG
jgi:membrane-bound metal-dependent hydrolase YbcI (DUF457 family)